MTRLGPYEVHPAADAFPMIDGEELAELADDIRRNGLREPIVLTHDGMMLIDGRNRLRACELADTDLVFVKLGAFYTESMILDFIVSENVRRRHLNPGQLAMVAADLEPMYAAAAKDAEAERKSGKCSNDSNMTPADLPESSGPEPSAAPNLFSDSDLAELNAPAETPSPSDRESRTKAAKKVGASPRATSQAKAVERDAPDLAKKVRNGEMALDAADRERKKRIAALPKPEPVTPSNVILSLRRHDGTTVEYPQPKAKSKFNETTGDGISWAAWSWNPVTGCLHGCRYCYAREIATNERYANAYPVGFTPLFHHERLDAPANTTIPAAHRNDPAYKRVFVCSMADLYGRWVPQDWIDQVHGAMCASPAWQYITLTKFPDRYIGLSMPPGAWVGTSVDEQKRVRIAERAFRQIDDVAVKWLSLEPLLEPLEFEDLSMFDWIVIGAQTETRQPTGIMPAFAPPFEWVARIVAQAREAGCKVHLKPNLLGAVGPNSPGMALPNEYPKEDC